MARTGGESEEHDLVVKVPGGWSAKDLATIQEQFDEIVKSGRTVLTPASSGGLVTVKAVLSVIDDWAQDHFGPVSWPEHTRDHVTNAITELRKRIQGLVS